MSEKPLITFLLVCYNQEHYIQEALKGAFSQTYSPLEILIADDASQDGTIKVVENCVADYDGPHLIKVNKNRFNIGIGANINKAMDLARGELIVAAAGDDISYSSRVEIIYNYWIASEKKVYSIFSAADFINGDGAICGEKQVSAGIVKGALELKRQRVRGMGATQAWHKDVFKLFGPMDNGVISEDIVIPFRAALLGHVGFINDKLVAYRVGVGISSEPLDVKKVLRYRISAAQHFIDVATIGYRSEQLERELVMLDQSYELLVGLYEGKVLTSVFRALRYGLGLRRTTIGVLSFLLSRYRTIRKVKDALKI